MWVTLLLLLAGFTILLLVRPARERLLESLKALSDLFVMGFLRGSSRFAIDLTEQGRAEQRLWREQRFRYLRSLGLRAKQARADKGSKA